MSHDYTFESLFTCRSHPNLLTITRVTATTHSVSTSLLGCIQFGSAHGDSMIFGRVNQAHSLVPAKKETELTMFPSLFHFPSVDFCPQQNRES